MTSPSEAAASAAAAVVSFMSKLKGVNLRENMVQLEIDGLVYTSVKLPARVGLELAPRVTSLLGAGLLRLVVTAEIEELGADKIAAALVMVSDRAMRDGLVPLVLDLLQKTQCGKLRGGGEGPVVPAFDSHFAGEYGHLLAVCAFVLAHNFRGPTYGVH
jgi:hypothetical protein